MTKFDLIVIGSGAGGLTSAFTALGFGKKVLIIESIFFIFLSPYLVILL